jgi:DNA-binding transcriptional regulator/RsmH inhibitor MraZ
MDEAIIENATFAIKIDDKTYLIAPQIHRESLLVKCMETDVEIDEIWAANDKELIEQIRQYNNKNKSIKKLSSIKY